MIIAVDLDGVICSEEKTFERALAKPIPGAKEWLAGVRAEGSQIVIYSARSWAEYALTTDWLQRHAIPYDALVLGKPIYDVFIDDRALRFGSWEQVSQELGPRLPKLRKRV